MWETLGVIATQLGMVEAAKLISEWKSLTPTMAASLANKIISAAEKKGSNLLNKALETVQNIPMLAGSPSVKEHLVRARQKGQSNYSKVEGAVSDLRSSANDVANKVTGMGDKSIISSTIDWIRTGKKDKARAEDLTKGFINNMQSIENKIKGETNV